MKRTQQQLIRPSILAQISNLGSLFNLFEESLINDIFSENSKNKYIFNLFEESLINDILQKQVQQLQMLNRILHYYEQDEDEEDRSGCTRLLDIHQPEYSIFDYLFNDQPEYYSIYDTAMDFISDLSALQEAKTIDHKPGSIDNKQGSFSLYCQHNDPNSKEDQPNQFRELMKKLQSSDFSSLTHFWGTGFKSHLNFLLKYWREFVPQFQEPMQNFLNIWDLNFSQQISNAIYPGFSRLIRNVSTKLDFKGSKGNLNIMEEHKNNYFLRQFINESKVKAKKEGSYFVKDDKKNTKKSMGEYIADNGYFKEDLKTWKKILFMATCQNRYNKDVTPHLDIHKQIDNIHKFAQLSLNNHQLGQPCNQLCCSKFFYLDFDICPLENLNVLCRPQLQKLKPYIKKSDIDRNRRQKDVVVEVPSQQQNELHETLLDVCGLLNRGGGVVLFNVKQVYLQWRPAGESIIKQEMEQYKNLIKQQIKNIFPNVYFDKEITVSFVPLVKNPYEYDYVKEALEQDDRMQNRFYVDGLYIMRIAVVPSKREELYYYSTGRDSVRSAVIKDNKRVTLTREEIVEEMKRKFQYFHVEAETKEEEELLAKDFTYMEKTHKCVAPYPGRTIVIKNSEENVKEPKIEFDKLSLMVAPSKYFDKIKRLLSAKGITVHISTRFQKYGFRSAMSSAPILHNVRFDQLLSEMAYKPEYEFDGRHLLIIRVTAYLKFVERKNDKVLPESDFISLSKWLKKEFPNQNLQYLICKDQDNIAQHYLKTESKESTVFIYYVLHQFGEKTMFKDPVVKPNHLQNRMEQIYPKKLTK